MKFNCLLSTFCVCFPLRGMDWDTHLHGKGSTVRSLLTDLYGKAGELKHWSLIRMISGMLRKKVEELDSVRHRHMSTDATVNETG